MFSSICENYGIRIQKAQTNFPDLYLFTEWYGVFKAEVEYYSSSFLKHKHNINDCNVIVCWKHDWEDCPIPVWELSDVSFLFGNLNFDEKDYEISRLRAKFTSLRISTKKEYKPINSGTGRPSIHEQRVFSYMEDAITRTGQTPTFSDLVRDLKLPQSTASRLHNKYINKH